MGTEKKEPNFPLTVLDGKDAWNQGQARYVVPHLSVPYHRSLYSASTQRGFCPCRFNVPFSFFFLFFLAFIFLFPHTVLQVPGVYHHQHHLCTETHHLPYLHTPTQSTFTPMSMSHAPCPHVHAPCPCHLNLPSQLAHPRSDRDPSFKSTFPVRARPGRPCPCTPALSLFALGLSALPPPFPLPPDYPVALHRHSSTTTVAPFDFLSSIHSFFFFLSSFFTSPPASSMF